MNNNLIWKLALAILVTANIATLGTVWYLHSRKIAVAPPLAGGVTAGRMPAGGASTFIIKELALSQAQQKDFEKLRTQHQERIRETRDKLRTAKDNLFSLLSKQDSIGIDKKAEAISNRIGVLEKRLDMHTFTHFKELRALCNDTQKKKFDSVIQQVLRMMGPALGGRPGLRPNPAPGGIKNRQPPPGGEENRESRPPMERHLPPPPEGHRPPPPDGHRPPPPDGEGPPPFRDGQRPPPPRDGRPPREGQMPPPPPPQINPAGT